MDLSTTVNITLAVLSFLLAATEEYLKEALLCYKSKYGICTTVDNYIIYFEPFAVMKFVAAE